MHVDPQGIALRPALAPLPTGRELRVRASELLRQVDQLGRVAIVDSAAWTALTLSALTLGASYMLGLGFELRAAGVIGASGLFVYNLDHLADSYRERGSAEQWKAGIGRTTLLFLVLVSALLLSLQLLGAPAAVGQVVAGYMLVGVLYGLPFFPMPGRRGLRWLRLKDVPGMKAVIVTSSITVAAVGLPLAWAVDGQGLGAWALQSPERTFAAVAPVALFVWTLVFCNTVMCDVGDLAADRRTGVKTLPVLLGVARTRRLLALLLVAVVGAFGLAGGQGLPVPYLQLFATTALVALYVGLVTDRCPKRVLSFALDGCSFVPLLAAMALHGQLG